MPWNDRTKRRLKVRNLDILMPCVIRDRQHGGKRANQAQHFAAGRFSKAIVETGGCARRSVVDPGKRGAPPTHGPTDLRIGQSAASRYSTDLRQGVQGRRLLADPTRRGSYRSHRTDHQRHWSFHAHRWLSRKITRRCFFYVARADPATLYREVLQRNIEFCDLQDDRRELLTTRCRGLFYDCHLDHALAKNPF